MRLFQLGPKLPDPSSAPLAASQSPFEKSPIIEKVRAMCPEGSQTYSPPIEAVGKARYVQVFHYPKNPARTFQVTHRSQGRDRDDFGLLEVNGRHSELRNLPIPDIAGDKRIAKTINDRLGIFNAPSWAYTGFLFDPERAKTHSLAGRHCTVALIDDSCIPKEDILELIHSGSTGAISLNLGGKHSISFEAETGKLRVTGFGKLLNSLSVDHTMSPQKQLEVVGDWINRNNLRIYEKAKHTPLPGAEALATTIARELIESGRPFYLKPEAMSRGRFVMRIDPSENGVRFETAEEDGANAVRLLLGGKDELANSVTVSVEAATKLLADLFQIIPDSIVEQEIPISTFRDLKLEWRVAVAPVPEQIPLTDESPFHHRVLDYYAKASANSVAANISLGGGSREGREAFDRLIFSHWDIKSESERAPHVMDLERDLFRRSTELVEAISTFTTDLASLYPRRYWEDRIRPFLRCLGVDSCSVFNSDSTQQNVFVLIEAQTGFGMDGLAALSNKRYYAVEGVRKEINASTEPKKRPRYTGGLARKLGPGEGMATAQRELNKVWKI